MSGIIPEGLVWGDVFCRGSTACGWPHHWRHILDADGKCKRCTYVQGEKAKQVIANLATTKQPKETPNAQG